MNNVCLIIVHESKFVSEVFEICRRAKGLYLVRHDGFEARNDWEFLIVPKFMIPNRIRGLLLKRVICYDTWLTRGTMAQLIARMRDAPTEVAYVDEPDELIRLVIETSDLQLPEGEDRTQGSR